ncbi:Collagen alpha-1(XV) chain [Eumeta japonica]|uniref:Collagen alpha-1(XV) chain n=1 Tax=Eumeta variegata TaxID=151549 RepID=A0A4C1YDR1_EUMVA|nr:Collagen alpha-1(XV) chain [Eumeta japonica]
MTLGPLVAQVASSSPPSPEPPAPVPMLPPSASLVHHPPSINTIESSLAGPSLRLAALNDATSGNTHGMRRADYACYRQARRAGLLGTFRAFLTSRFQNLESIVRFSDRELPVVNTQGDVLFSSFADMFDGSGAVLATLPRIYSFSGKNVMNDHHWPQKIIWHGAHASGERAPDNCAEWQSAEAGARGLASSLHSRKLLSQERNHTADGIDDEDYLYNSKEYQQLLSEIFAQPLNDPN